MLLLIVKATEKVRQTINSKSDSTKLAGIVAIIIYIKKGENMKENGYYKEKDNNL